MIDSIIREVTNIDKYQGLSVYTIINDPVIREFTSILRNCILFYDQYDETIIICTISSTRRKSDNELMINVRLVFTEMNLEYTFSSTYYDSECDDILVNNNTRFQSRFKGVYDEK